MKLVSHAAPFIFFTLLIATVVAGAILQNRADEICRARARDPDNVTLCRGEAYAANFLGEIGCRCQE